MPAKKTKLSVRKFYKTVFRLEVLSEEEIPNGADIDDVWHQCRDGAYSGEATRMSEKILDGRQAARALQKQGSDPSFFMLTAKGEEVDD